MTMSAFNKGPRTAKPSSLGTIHTEKISSGPTAKGGQGFAYEGKSALFLAAVSSMFGQKKFHAEAGAESARFVKLVKEAAVADPVWTLDFITWLRQQGNMRTSAVVASIEAASVAPANPHKVPGATGWARGLARAGIGRADEIGEALAYWQATYPGKQIPKPIKRGLADSCVNLINEFSATKYNP